MINRIARQTGFVKRIRKLPASRLVNTLMFSFCNQANASLPDITADLNQQFDIDISKEALHKKFTPQGVDFLKELIKEQLSHQLTFFEDKEINKHFPCIKIKDSSKFSLPDMYNGDYPGFGNFSKKNGLMNLQYEYELVRGHWESIELTNVKTNDQRDSKQTVDSITKGSLHIRDLGYITHTYLKSCIKKQAYFLNRMPAQINIYCSKEKKINWTKIDGKIKQTGLEALEMNVLIYQKDPLACRLIVVPVNDEEYRHRLKQAEQSAKRHGVGISKEHKIRCRYNLYITNVGRDVLPIEKIRKTYGLRWQIELVFKTWKSFFQINHVKKVKKERLECQLLAKLLWILLNWRLFQTCNQYIQRENPEKGVSVLKFFKRCLAFSSSLRSVVLKKMDIQAWLQNIFIPLIDNTACESPKGKITHYQLLNAMPNLLS